MCKEIQHGRKDSATSNKNSEEENNKLRAARRLHNDTLAKHLDDAGNMYTYLCLYTYPWTP